MLDRLILSAVMGVAGWNGLYPSEPEPMTPHQLRVKAIEASKSEACKSKKKTKALKEFCDRRKDRLGGKMGA